MITTDKGLWEVVAEVGTENGYRIASGSTVIAHNLTLAAATQIVDEHLIVRRIMSTLAEREAAMIAVHRAPL
jgi:hypothetical protein